MRVLDGTHPEGYECPRPKIQNNGSGPVRVRQMTEEERAYYGEAVVTYTPDYLPKDFGAYLRDERTKKGWSQARLGKLIGVTQATIFDYEKNRRKPSRETLVRIFDVMRWEV